MMGLWLQVENSSVETEIIVYASATKISTLNQITWVIICVLCFRAQMVSV